LQRHLRHRVLHFFMKLFLLWIYIQILRLNEVAFWVSEEFPVGKSSLASYKFSKRYLVLSGLRREAAKKIFCESSKETFVLPWPRPEGDTEAERERFIFWKKILRAWGEEIPLRSNHNDEPQENTGLVILHHLLLR